MEHDAKNNTPTTEPTDKKLRIKTRNTQPKPPPPFPCSTFFF